MTLTNVMHGRPMKADAEKMAAHFRTKGPGYIFEHGELCAVIQEERNGRYNSIRSKAVQIFFDDTGVRLQSVHGVGLRYPQGDEQIREGVRRMRGSVRGIARATRTIADVTDERLPDPKWQAARDHLTGRMRILVETAKTEHRALAARVGTPEVSPQMALPKQ